MQPNELDHGLPPLDDDVTPEQLAMARQFIGRAAADNAAFYEALCGTLPDWVWRETWVQVNERRAWLHRRGFTDTHIVELAASIDDVLDASNTGPGYAVGCLTADFVKAVNYLAHVRYAVSLGPEEGLKELYGHHAAAGYASNAGASVGGSKAAESRRKEGKLDERDARIRKARASGATVADLAARFSISERQIRNVLKGPKAPKAPKAET